MEKDDVVLIKDIIPNYSMSKKVAELLGTKVRIEDINRTEIKVKGVWIPKEFVKEVAFKHYTEEELARRSKIEEYGEYLAEKTAPLSLKIARSFSKYVVAFLEIMFVLFILSFFATCISSSKIFETIVVIICFVCVGGFFLAVGSYLILCAIIKKHRVEENFLDDVQAKTIKSLKVSEEELERLKIYPIQLHL